MRLALLTASVSRRGGGVFEVVRRLGQSLAGQPGLAVQVFGLRDADADADIPQWLPLVPRLFAVQGPHAFGYARRLTGGLCEAGVDLVHTHGLWMYPSAACAAWSRHTRRRYVVSPHGMLDPWALRRSRWKKGLARVLYEGAHLRGAACLQASSPAEAAHVRRLGLHNAICVIPNGVDLPAGPSTCPPPWRGLVEPGRKVLLFLGRIHPKKGLPNLLAAWARLRAAGCLPLGDWALAVAGWDQGGHEAELKSQARELGLGDDVCFVGPQFHEARQAAYQHASAFVLPSVSEGLPMAVLEALAHGLPVLLTPECNLPEAFTCGAGLPVAADPEDIARGLGELVGMTDRQRQAIGERGRRLVAKDFAWDSVAAQMRAVYSWVLGGGPAPACVLPAGRPH
jgi:poly(glycerol-phosphate) alpha-glucosyltransferase